MKKEYSYDIYNDLGRVQGGNLTEEAYNEALKRTDIELVQEWETEYKEEITYGKQYKVGKDYRLFIWKKVFKESE